MMNKRILQEMKEDLRDPKIMMVVLDDVRIAPVAMKALRTEYGIKTRLVKNPWFPHIIEVGGKWDKGHDEIQGGVG